MFDRSRFRTVTSLLLSLLLIFATMPASVSASDTSSAVSSLGSVNGTGTVELRGVAVNQEGTLFPGDRVRTGSRSYAKVILVNGNKVELSSDTAFTVNRVNQQIRLVLTSGNVAFTASQSPLTIVIGNYEVVPNPGSSGSVAFTGSELAGIRMLSGNASLRDLGNKSSVSIVRGTERLLALRTGQNGVPLAKVASALPTPLPQGAGGVPAAVGGASGMSSVAWVAVIGTLVGAAGALGVLMANGEAAPGDAQSNLAAQVALQNLSELAAATTQTGTLASNVTSVAVQAQTAIQAATGNPQQASLLNLVQGSLSAASSASESVGSLQSRIAELQAAIQSSGNVTSSQQDAINSYYVELLVAVNNANFALTQLNFALNAARSAGVASVPANPTFQPLTAPTLASQSNPV